MKCCVSNLLVFRRVTHLELTITSIEPWGWVARAIVLGKFELVDGREVEVVILVAGVVVAAISLAEATIMHGVLNAG
jgi:hypothetical protein